MFLSSYSSQVALTGRASVRSLTSVSSFSTSVTNFFIIASVIFFYSYRPLVYQDSESFVRAAWSDFANHAVYLRIP